MKRDLKKLAESKYDVIIVGAGIYGAAMAWDASQRGLKVAVIDKGDFGAATSANSLKIIHGGLRYLQQLDIKRMRESIRERRLMMGIASHLCHPLPCVMPTFGHMMKGPEVMFCGMLANDVISFDRNKLPDPEKRIPMGKVISRDYLMKLVPGVDPDGVNGAAFWTDGQVYNSERLTLAFLQSAVQEGAQAANYVKVNKFLVQGNRVEGVEVTDELTGESYCLSADVTVNTAGAWMDCLLASDGLPDNRPRVNLSTAMNLVVKKELLKGSAAGVYGRFTNTLPNGETYNGRRVLFMAPWREYTIIGTFHRNYEGSPDEMRVSEAEIEEALAEANTAVPNSPITRDDVTFVLKGFLPMEGINPKNGEVNLTKHYKLYDHAREDGVEGLVSVSGVKYTTARDVAVKTVSRVAKKLKTKAAPSRSHKTALVGGNILHFQDFLHEAQMNRPENVSDKSMSHLVHSFGSEYKQVLKLAKDKPELLETLPGSDEVLKVEVIWAVREEMACRLSDVILRRTDVGSGEKPLDATLAACADLMAVELGWDKKRVKDEIEAAKAVYETVK